MGNAVSTSAGLHQTLPRFQPDTRRNISNSAVSTLIRVSANVCLSPRREEANSLAKHAKVFSLLSSSSSFSSSVLAAVVDRCFSPSREVPGVEGSRWAEAV